jgi:hypothetical protein
MRADRFALALWWVIASIAAGCTLDTMGTASVTPDASAGGSAGLADASVGGAAGAQTKGGSAGQAGSDASVGGNGGVAGQGGAAGSAGDGGAGGAAGSSGSGGVGGAAGDGGTGGSAGVAGTAGSSGSGGSAGNAGTAGSGGAAGNAGAAGSGGATLQAWRAPITITTTTASLPADYTVRVDINHLSLVTLAKSVASGDDVRILRWDGSTWTEVDRVADPSTPWNSAVTRTFFRLQAAQNASTTSSSFWVYYGPAIQGMPKDDGKQAFLRWDSFDGSALGSEWTLAQIGAATASATVSGGRVRLQCNGDDAWGNADNIAFLYQPLSGNFVIDTYVVARGGTLDGWAKMGGVMLRQSTAAGSRNRLMSPVNGSVARTNSYRLTDEGVTVEDAIAGANPIPEWERLTRAANQSRAWYSLDGLTFVEDGTVITFGTALTDPVLVGIPLAPMNTGNQGWVEVDWFRARRSVAQAPTVTLGIEEATTFPPSGAP